MMSTQDNELMRRFQALRRVIPDTGSENSSSSSAPLLLHKQQQQNRPYSQPVEQQLPLSQPIQKLESKQKNKKKCRGNRRRQRYRTRLRKQGLTNETITTLIQDYDNTDQGQDESQSSVSDMNVELLIPAYNQVRSDCQKIMENNITKQTKSVKRKRESRTTNVTTSMSQISLSNLPKKRQHTTVMGDVVEEKRVDKSTSDNSKPKYLKVPDQVFKEMLAKSLAGADHIIPLLDTPEKLVFVRTYAHLLSNVFYWKLEQDYWEHYYNVCTTKSIWSSPLMIDLAKENNLSRFKFKTEAQLDKHRKLIGNRLQEAENKLNQHKLEPINRSMNMNRLSTVIPAFVRQGQHKLGIEFERKKLILQFDANDHCLVKTFYNMKPTKSQVYK